MRLSAAACSLSLAVMAAIFSLVLGIWHSATGYGAVIVDILSSLYANTVRLTYDPLKGFGGNLSGNSLSILLLTLFGLLDGAVLGVIWCSLYNIAVRLTSKK